MSQFVLTRYGRIYKPNGLSSVLLPNIPMTFIKNNNHYYNPHSARGRVGASCQAGNLNAVRRRV